MVLVPLLIVIVIAGIYVGGYKLHQRSAKSKSHSLAWGAEDPPGW